jgi:serine/threonine-protein kinase
MILELGQRYGKYETISLLGVGSFGEVYKVRHLLTKEVQALKVFKWSQLSTAPDHRAVRELLGLRSVQCKHIIRPIDFEPIANHHALSMEYVDGKSLDVLIGTNDSSLTLPVCRQILEELLMALRVAHDAGIIHRDIKPANVIVANGSHTAKLGDFGVAYFADMARITKITQGTPLYMAPDCRRDKKPKSVHDIYSLGVTAYEMLSREFPRQANGEDYFREALQQTVPVRLSDLVPEIPAWLSDIVMCALAKNPRDRFQTAAEMLEALKQGAPVPRVKTLPFAGFGQPVNVRLHNPRGPSRYMDMPMLVDTGCEATVVPGSIADTLGLFSEGIGRTRVRTPAGNAEAYVIPVILELLDIKKRFTISALVIPGYPMTMGLLGRDVLRHLRITFDGPGGSMEMTAS